MFCFSVLFQEQHCDENLITVTAHVADIVALHHVQALLAERDWWLRSVLA